MSKRCPKCRLISPPEAERCDCAWDFVSERQERSYLPPRSRAATAAAGAGAAGVLLLLLAKLVLIFVHSSMGRH
jgi:hypothetical protein